MTRNSSVTTGFLTVLNNLDVVECKKSRSARGWSRRNCSLVTLRVSRSGRKRHSSSANTVMMSDNLYDPPFNGPYSISNHDRFRETTKSRPCIKSSNCPQMVSGEGQSRTVPLSDRTIFRQKSIPSGQKSSEVCAGLGCRICDSNPLTRETNRCIEPGGHEFLSRSRVQTPQNGKQCLVHVSSLSTTPESRGEYDTKIFVNSLRH